MQEAPQPVGALEETLVIVSWGVFVLHLGLECRAEDIALGAIELKHPRP